MFVGFELHRPLSVVQPAAAGNRVIKAFSFCWTNSVKPVFSRMRLSHRFVLLLTVAAALAAIIKIAPRGAAHEKALWATPMSPVTLGAAIASLSARPVESDPKVATTTPSSVEVEQKISNRLRVPAIRGFSNYGWVQLPPGTPVDLVRQQGKDLLVRWEGTVVAVDPSSAANGAIVLRKTGS